MNPLLHLYWLLRVPPEQWLGTLIITVLGGLFLLFIFHKQQ